MLASLAPNGPAPVHNPRTCGCSFGFVSLTLLLSGHHIYLFRWSVPHGSFGRAPLWFSPHQSMRLNPKAYQRMLDAADAGVPLHESLLKHIDGSIVDLDDKCTAIQSCSKSVRRAPSPTPPIFSHPQTYTNNQKLACRRVFCVQRVSGYHLQSLQRDMDALRPSV